jgi:hypothetical protein
MTDDTTSISRRRPWPWWLRTPHSRLFSEWIELKSEHTQPDSDENKPAA